MRNAILAASILTLLSGCIDLNQRGGGTHPRRPLPPDPAPGPYVPPDPNWPRGLVIGGGVTLAASWVVSTVMVGAGPSRMETCPASDYWCDPHHTYSGWLVVPSAGPALALMDNIGKVTPPLRGELAYYGTAMAVNAAALVVVLIGAVNDGPAGPRGPIRLARGWTVAPLASPQSTGAALSGSF